MNEVEVETVADPDLSDPLLVEGLPGVGHVGKLAAEHLLEEFESRLVRRVRSEHLPPQVGIDEDGVVGAVTEAELAEELRGIGVEFHEDEPEGGIVGTSGLLLGLGARREDRADEMEDAVAEMQEGQVGGVTDGDENLRYFG